MKKQLTERQKQLFKKHSNHHTQAHIKRMKKEILENNKTFTEAHKIALKFDKKKKQPNKKMSVMKKKKICIVIK